MNHKKVSNNVRPLNLGVLPPWQLTVTLADGEKRLIKIPYSDGIHVLGLPLGSDVPEVVAKNYKILLCMVNGMTSVISDLTRKLDQQQQDAARSLDDANRYRFELPELMCTIDGGMAAHQEGMAPISPSKKRKLSAEISGPCNEPEHSPPPRSSDTPAIPISLVRESVTEDNVDDLPLTSVKRSLGENDPTSEVLDTSEVQTGKVESAAGVRPVGQPVDATMISSPANCLTVDSTALTIPTPVDITPALVESTSISDQGGDEGFEYVENFKIPKEYAVLYKKIFRKYGHMATKKVIKFNGAILLACVTSLLKIASKMETVRGMDLSVVLVESWEGDIQDAETLQFNIGWLHEKFDRLKNFWKSSIEIDENVESLEQVLDAARGKYGVLYSRKDELEAELSEVKTAITESGAMISAQREAIREKLAQKNTFMLEPVLGNLVGDSLEITN